MKRHSLILVLITVTAPAARGHASADSAQVDEISRLLDERHAEAAYQRALALVATAPEDLEARYAAAVAAVSTGRLREAREHASAGLLVAPDEAGLLGLLGYTMLAQGDLSGARATSQRAQALESSEPVSTEVAAQLGAIDRAERRLAGEDPRLDPGSAMWVVDRVLERVFAGATSFELASYFDVDGNAQTLAMDLEEARRSFRNRAEEMSQDQLGWSVRGQDVDGDVVRVDVEIVSETVITQTLADEWKRTVPASPSMPPDVIDMLDNVEASEHELVIDRLVGTHQFSVTPVQFEVVPTGVSYRVRDVSLGGVSLREMMRSPPRMASEAPDRRKSFAYWFGYYSVPLAIGIICLYWLLRRR